jgi:hypothetical protein
VLRCAVVSQQHSSAAFHCCPGATMFPMSTLRCYRHQCSHSVSHPLQVANRMMKASRIQYSLNVANVPQLRLQPGQLQCMQGTGFENVQGCGSSITNTHSVRCSLTQSLLALALVIVWNKTNTTTLPRPPGTELLLNFIQQHAILHQSPEEPHASSSRSSSTSSTTALKHRMLLTSLVTPF